jgi:hypothetical protein
MIERRKCERFVVPGATVSYKKRGLWGRQTSFPEDTFPLVDLSKGGLAFLSNRSLKKGHRVSLLLYFSESENEDPIHLTGIVVSSILTMGIINQYRVGIQFKPFGIKRGFNTPESLKKLEELERTYLSK